MQSLPGAVAADISPISLLSSSVLGLVLSYLPGQFEYRQINRAFDHAIQLMHSHTSPNYIPHTFRCHSVQEFTSRFSRMPWLSSWVLVITSDPYEWRAKPDARSFQSILRQADAELQFAFFELLSKLNAASSSPSTTLSIELNCIRETIDSSDILEFAEHCHLASTSSNSISTHITKINAPCFASDALFIEFVQSPHISQLGNLYCEEFPSSLEAYQALASSPYLSNMTSLTLDSLPGDSFLLGGYEPMTLEHILVLSESASLSHNLSSLTLSNLPCMSDDEFIALISTPFVANLTSLSLSRLPIADRSIDGILSTPYLENLTQFIFDGAGGGRVSPAAIRQLISSHQFMSKLKTLSISNLAIHLWATEEFSSPYFSQLQSLTFGGCGIGTSALEALVAHGPLSALTHLSLPRNYLDIAASEFIAESGRLLPALRHLDVSFNELMAQRGRSALFSINSLEVLDMRRVNNNQVDDSADDIMTPLLECKVGSNMKKLIVWTSAAFKRRMSERFPQLTIEE